MQAMKNIFYTIICCLISLTSLAQSDFGYENPDGRDPREEGMQRDSTKEQRYVPHHRLTWKWVHDGVYKEFYQIVHFKTGYQNTNLYSNTVFPIHTWETSHPLTYRTFTSCVPEEKISYRKIG